MSEYDDWLFNRDENQEFQRELPEILKDGFANQRRGLRGEPDYLSLYVNDFTPKELLAKTQADRQKRIAWFERERQQEQDRIAGLSPTEKLLEAVNRGAILLPSEVAEEIKAIFTPATLATMVGVFAAYIAAHATGIGQAMDIGMLIAGGIFFGLDAFAIFKDIAGFAGAVNATTEEELDQAGEHLASAVAKIGVDALWTLLTRKVADKIADTGKTSVDLDAPKKSPDGSIKTTGDMNEVNRSIRRNNAPRSGSGLYTEREVGEEISKSPVASKAYQRITRQGTDVILDSNIPSASNLDGQFDPTTNKINIYEMNHLNPKDVVTTLVHESTHVDYRYGRKIKNNTRYEEFRAFCRQHLYEFNERPSLEERRQIWEFVNTDPDYKKLPQGKNPFEGNK